MAFGGLRLPVSMTVCENTLLNIFTQLPSAHCHTKFFQDTRKRSVLCSSIQFTYSSAQTSRRADSTTFVVSSLCTTTLCTRKATTQKDTIPSTAEPARWGNRSQGSTVTSITLKVSEWAQTAPPTLKCHLKEHENALCLSEGEGEAKKHKRFCKILHTVSACRNGLI